MNYQAGKCLEIKMVPRIQRPELQVFALKAVKAIRY